MSEGIDEGSQPVDLSSSTPLDLSQGRTAELPWDESLLRVKRIFSLSVLESDWSEEDSHPWRYSDWPSDRVSPTPPYHQDIEPDSDSSSEAVETSELENFGSRGFSDSEEFFVFSASRSELNYLKLWSFPGKSKTNSDISRYSEPAETQHQDELHQIKQFESISENEEEELPCPILKPPEDSEHSSDETVHLHQDVESEVINLSLPVFHVKSDVSDGPRADLVPSNDIIMDDLMIDLP